MVKSLSRVNPNVLTLIGSIPPLLFFVLVLNHQYALAFIAFLGSFFDFIDGMVARKYNKVTNFGGFLDSTMDRIGDFFLITSFAFGDIIRWEIVAPVLLFSFLISYARAQGGVRNDGDANFASGIGVIERAERYILIIIALIIYFLLPTVSISGFNLAECIFILLLILSFYTLAQRINYAYKKL